MTLPIEELTPRQIVAELDRYIIGQDKAKRAVAVALRNRFRRQQLPPEEREDILPKNILMIGPTGVGKTEIARRLAQLARAPFVKVEATKFTEVGYVGRDVESMIRELAAAAVRLVERERAEEVREEAERRAKDTLIDLLESQYPEVRPDDEPGLADVDPELVQLALEQFGLPAGAKIDNFDYEAEEKHREEYRQKLRGEYEAGQLDERDIEVEIEEAGAPSFVQVFSAQGMEEMGLDTQQMGGQFSTRHSTLRTKVKDAIGILKEQEAKRLIDKSDLHREAIYRAEQTGIIFLDEIDKVAGKSGGSGPDVSREGVQRDLLPIIEGSTVATKFGPLRTDHILFIAAGAFHISKPSELIPELQGRLPIRVELEPLTGADFRRILSEPRNALTKQYERLLEVDGVEVVFTSDGLDEVARLAAEVNTRTENIGARRLHTIMERLLEEVLFEAPETDKHTVIFDAVSVRDRLASLVNNVDLSRSIL